MWCLILVSLGATAVVLTIITKTSGSIGLDGRDQTKTVRTLIKHGWYTFHILIGQGK